MGFGGLLLGVWKLAKFPIPKSQIPNPQSPIPNILKFQLIKINELFKKIIHIIKVFYLITVLYLIKY